MLIQRCIRLCSRFRSTNLIALIVCLCLASFQDPVFGGVSFTMPAQEACCANSPPKVSANGVWVVWSGPTSMGIEAHRWSATTGFITLGDLPGGWFSSEATGVSDDGLVVVGRGDSGNGIEAFRWVEGVGMSGLGDFPGNVFESIARGVSRDGSVVVGSGRAPIGLNGFRPFRWTQATGLVDIGVLPSGLNGAALGVSYDGLVVVGVSQSGPGEQAFRWVDGAGMTGLGDLPGGGFFSVAEAVSGDGQTVVGAGSNSLSEPFRWRNSEGMIGLGSLPEGQAGGVALATTEIGDIVIGRTSGSGVDTAFIWRSESGMRALGPLLTSLGINLSCLRLTSATGISANGQTIVGFVTNDCNGQIRPWVLQLTRNLAVSLMDPASTSIHCSAYSCQEYVVVTGQIVLRDAAYLTERVKT